MRLRLRADPADLVLVAEHGADIVGAARLCTEHGYLILRGMVVREDRQRQGIGRQMLSRLEELMAGRDCYLIGHDYLRSFYGAIGFTPIPADRAPAHLQERLRGYVERGEPEIIMQRYYGMTTYESSPSYWFHHKLSDIISGCIDAGLRITRFGEHGHDISSVFTHFERLTIKPPLCYTLVARRD